MRTTALLLGAVLGIAAPGAMAGEAPPVPVAAPTAAPPVAPPAAASSPAALADPFAGRPKALAAAVKELEEACRAEGGVASWTPHALFGEVNISPDGVPDYLVTTHGMTCSASVTPWVGSDGFRYIVLVSTGKGKWVRAFDRSARGFEITQGEDPRIVLLSHSGDCTKPNPERYQRCTQEYAWRRGKLKLIFEAWETE